MTRSAKTLLGIFSFLPFLFGILMVIWYVYMISHIFSSINRINDPAEFMPMYFSEVFSWKLWALALLSVATHLTLMIIYIVHAVRHETSEGLKAMWIVLFIFVGAIAYVIYYFLKVAPQPASDDYRQQLPA